MLSPYFVATLSFVHMLLAVMAAVNVALSLFILHIIFIHLILNLQITQQKLSKVTFLPKFYLNCIFNMLKMLLKC